MTEKSKRIYYVSVAVWGADRKEDYYFRTKEEAEVFEATRNYTSTGYTRVGQEEAEELLDLTQAKIAYESKLYQTSGLPLRAVLFHSRNGSSGSGTETNPPRCFSA